MPLQYISFEWFVGLEQCADVRVANCSGGQKKRLSIALELISSPSILLLDEPTSGLDSVSSLQCISLLRKLSNSEEPMIIATSIHQPTARILSMFDNLYILSHTGQCIYNGSTNDLINYLNGFGLQCPIFHNPADFVLEIASGDHGNSVLQALIDEQHNNNNNNIVTVNDESIPISKICQKSRKQKSRREPSKTLILLNRCLLVSFRDPTVYWLRIFGVLLICLLTFIIYYETPIGEPNGCARDTDFNITQFTERINEINDMRELKDFVSGRNLAQTFLMNTKRSAMLNFGFVFFIALFTTFITLMPTILTFPLEVSVFAKEHFNGWYSVGSYYLAKSITNLLPSIIFPLIFAVAVYYFTSQIWEVRRFVLYLVIITLMSLLIEGFGLSVSSYFSGMNIKI